MKRHTFKIDHADGSQTVYVILATDREADAQFLLELSQEDGRTVTVYTDGSFTREGR